MIAPTPVTCRSAAVSGYSPQSAAISRSVAAMRALSSPITSISGSSAVRNSPGMCSAALRWKLGAADVVDELRPRAHERVAATHYRQILLGPGAAVPDGGEQFGVEASEASEQLSVDAVVLAVATGDQRNLPDVGHDHFVAEIRQQPAQPR